MTATISQDVASLPAPNSDAMNSLEKLLARIDRDVVKDTLGLLQGAAHSEATTSGAKHVLFLLDGTQYAIPLENVLEIQRLPRVTALPHVPEWLRGVTNLRGDILSVVDLRVLLSLNETPNSTAQRLLVVRSTREELVIGWVVDRVIGIRGVAPGEVKSYAAQTGDSVAPFIQGLVERDGRFMAVLDVDIILASPELRQFDLESQA